jgi:Skp family chaperone for outer membrane proteins
MKPMHRTALLACVFAALAVTVNLAAEPAPAAAKAPVIAVVDMSRVLDKSAQWDDSAAKRKKKSVDFARVAEADQSGLSELDFKLQQSPPGAARDKARETLMKMARMVQEKRAKAKDEIDALFNKDYGDLFAELNTVCTAHAAKNGIDIVLKHQTRADTSRPSAIMELHMSAILFAGARLDITDAVIEALNDSWGQAAIEED